MEMEETGNIRKSTYVDSKIENQVMLGAWNPGEWEPSGLVHKGSLLAPENHAKPFSLTHCPPKDAWKERKQLSHWVKVHYHH